MVRSVLTMLNLQTFCTFFSEYMKDFKLEFLGFLCLTCVCGLTEGILKKWFFTFFIHFVSKALFYVLKICLFLFLQLIRILRNPHVKLFTVTYFICGKHFMALSYPVPEKSA